MNCEPSVDARTALFSLDSGQPLLTRICQQLGTRAARHEERAFEDGEHKLRPLESVRGRDVYIVESFFSQAPLSVDDKLMRVLLFSATVRDAGASRVTVVAPYLCYARKDLRTKARDPVTLRYVAQLFESVGVDRMVALDVHNPAAYQNAFRIPAELLTARGMLVEACARLVSREAVVVVSPDPGGVKRAERFRQALERHLERSVGFAFLDKQRSEGVVRSGALAGEVSDRVAILVDDLISSGTTLARAESTCREHGARVTYAAATHGLFSADAGRVLGQSAFARIFVLDSTPGRALSPELAQRVEALDCAPLLAAAIRRLHADESLSELSDAGLTATAVRA